MIGRAAVLRTAFSVVVAAVLAACGPDNTPPPAGPPVLPSAIQDGIVVGQGETLRTVAERAGVDPSSLAAANGLGLDAQVTPGQTLRMPSFPYHIVEPGQSLGGIARAYNLDPMMLARANNLPQPYTLSAGQRVRLPIGTPVARVAADGAAGTGPYAAGLATPGAGLGVAAITTEPLGTPGAPGGYRPVLPLSGLSDEVAPAPAASLGTGPSHPTSILPGQTPVPATGTPTVSAQPQATLPGAPLGQPAAPPPPATSDMTVAPPAAPGPAPATTTVTTSAGRPNFTWPVRGPVVSSFGPKAGGERNDGINIAADAGTAVAASAAGDVAYAGNELRGFGNLVLLRHADGWVTVYAHLSEILVRPGDPVSAGQTIGRVGSTGSVTQPQLHFEIRRDSEARDPELLLGPR